MAIPAVEAISSGSMNSSAATKNDEVGMDQFLTLLVAQMKYQDPLNPLDGTDFTAQLAQFTALEQQFQTNDQLEEILTAVKGQESGYVLDYIGKTVKTLNNAVFVEDGEANAVSYTLDDRAEVTLQIYDEDGNEVRSIYKGWQDAGSHDFDWDGLNNAGSQVDNGTYIVEVDAVDEQGYVVAHEEYVNGEVSGVTYYDGTPYLMIGDKVVALTNVTEVTTTQPVEE
jgi:flagellar basal-body rod modification protein FlgD